MARQTWEAFLGAPGIIQWHSVIVFTSTEPDSTLRPKDCKFGDIKSCIMSLILTISSFAFFQGPNDFMK